VYVENESDSVVRGRSRAHALNKVMCSGRPPMPTEASSEFHRVCGGARKLGHARPQHDAAMLRTIALGSFSVAKRHILHTRSVQRSSCVSGACHEKKRGRARPKRTTSHSSLDHGGSVQLDFQNHAKDSIFCDQALSRFRVLTCNESRELETKTDGPNVSWGDGE
jgi:hypothetical protein